MIAILLALTFTVLLLSGGVLFVAPNGRIAREIGWGFAALTRQDWFTVHTGFAIIFVIAGLIHITRHWRAIANYAMGCRAGQWRMAVEGIAALVITLALIIAILAQLPPVSYITDLHHYFRTQAWSADTPESEGRGIGPAWRRSR